MSRNDHYTKGILLDYFYHQRYCKLVGTDLSGETNKSISQKTNFIEKKEKSPTTRNTYQKNLF